MLKKEIEISIDFKKREALLICIAVISSFVAIYISILDMLALYHSYDKNPFISVELHNVSALVAGNDFLLTLIVGFLAVFNFYRFYKNVHLLSSCVIMMILLFIFIIATHLPFIVIAYLNDAYNAGSILIFYVVSFLILLAVVELGYYVTWQKPIPKEIAVQKEDIEIIDDSKITIINVVLANSDQNGFNDVSKKTLNLNEASEATIESARLTFRDDKLWKGELNHMHLKFEFRSESPKRKNYGTFCELARNNCNLLIECNLRIKDTKDISVRGNSECEIEPDLESGTVHIHITKVHLEKQSINFHIFCIILCVIFPFFLTLFWIVLTAAYLVLIPINRSISDAPDRLLGLFHPLILLVGAYIYYKTFIKKKISLKSVVEESMKSFSSTKDDERWSSMSKEERLAEFYKTNAQMIMYQARQLSK